MQTFDADGNNTSDTVTLGNEVTYDGTYHYQYDKEGNETLMYDTTTSTTWSYSYDDENQMTEAQETIGYTLVMEANYEYDAFGSQVEENVGTTATEYVQDHWNPATAGATGLSGTNVVADVTAAGSLITGYVWGNEVDQLFGRYDTSLSSVPTAGAYYLFVDQNGSVRDVVNSSGVDKDSIKYDGFGAFVTQTNANYLGLYGYDSYHYDAATGNYDDNARDYDPVSQRWVTMDPDGIGGGTPNLYEYAGNDPTNEVDPSGLEQVIGGQGFGSPGGGQMENNRKVAGPWEQFQLFGNPNGGPCAIAYNTGFLCALNGGGGGVVANRGIASGWETWTLIPNGDGTVSLQSCDGHYLCSQDDGQVVANRDTNAGWERFHLVPIDEANHIYALQDWAGDYLSAQPAPSSQPYTSPWYTYPVASLKGLGQGGLNLVNGVQDVGIGIANAPAALGNVLSGPGVPKIPYIPSPDWSKDLLVENDPLHGTSKFLGGEGAVTIATLGSGTIAKWLGTGARTAEEAAAATRGAEAGLEAKAALEATEAKAALEASEGEICLQDAPKTKFPETDAQVKHIFRDAEGHLPDTAANRSLLQGVADNPANTLGADRFGNTWSAHLNADGTQTWVQTRNGVIINGGVNATPRTFNPNTGLSGPGGK